MLYRFVLTVFKIFICGGILSDIQSEILFYGDSHRSRKLLFPTVYPMTYSPNENFEYGYPHSNALLQSHLTGFTLINFDVSYQTSRYKSKCIRIVDVYTRVTEFQGSLGILILY